MPRSLFQKLLAAGDEVCQRLALKHSVGEQGKVCELAEERAFLVIGLNNLLNQRVFHIDDDIVGLRKLTIEIETSVESAHLTVATHELALGDEYRLSILTQILSLDLIVIALKQN